MIGVRCNLKLFLRASIPFIIVCAILAISQQLTTTCHQRISSKWKVCLLSMLGENSVNSSWLTGAVNFCSKKYLPKSTQLIPLPNKDEIKHVVLPANQNSSYCNVVTLGIGDDILAEENLRQYLPYCKFFGADPEYKMGKIYETLGKFYHVAVGARSGNYTASVFVNYQYLDSQVQHVSWREFVDNMTRLNFIDYLFMDVEGQEYKLLPLLAENDKDKSKTEDLAICQINAEFHVGISSAYGVTDKEIVEIFKSFVAQSNHVPVFAAVSGHHRIVFMDIISPKCVEKYLPHFCSTFYSFKMLLSYIFK